MAIYNKTLHELLPLSLFSTPAVSIRGENKIWIATAMLVHHLESFTDSLVVTDKENNPIGIFGGIEIIKNVFENPTNELFEKTTVNELMEPDLVFIKQETTLKELVDKWKQSRRAFSIIPNQLGGYSAISARKILEIAANCKTDLTVSDLLKKPLISFTYDETMGEIINKMIQNNTRKLVFKNSSAYISDRIIIQTIAQELNYLHDTENFLDQKFENPFKLDDLKHMSEDTNLADLSKLMFGMLHPYVMAKDQVYTPWDICVALLSECIEYVNKTAA